MPSPKLIPDDWPPIHVQIPPGLLEAVTAYGKRMFPPLSTADAVRHLLMRGTGWNPDAVTVFERSEPGAVPETT